MPEVLSYVCPTCGSEVRVGGPCSGCSKKSKKPAWETDKSYDGLDLPNEVFDYDDFIAREFGKSPHRSTGLRWYWWLLAIGVLASMLAAAFMIL